MSASDRKVDEAEQKGDDRILDAYYSYRYALFENDPQAAIHFNQFVQVVVDENKKNNQFAGYILRRYPGLVEPSFKHRLLSYFEDNILLNEKKSGIPCSVLYLSNKLERMLTRMDEIRSELNVQYGPTITNKSDPRVQEFKNLKKEHAETYKKCEIAINDNLQKTVDKLTSDLRTEKNFFSRYILFESKYYAAAHAHGNPSTKKLSEAMKKESKWLASFFDKTIQQYGKTTENGKMLFELGRLNPAQLKKSLEEVHESMQKMARLEIEKEKDLVAQKKLK